MEILEDDDVKLPEDTLKLLQQFLKEKEELEKEEISEDWNLSQFW